MFVCPKAPRGAVEPTRLRASRLPRASCERVKWPGDESEYTPHLVPKVKNVWSYTYTFVGLYASVI
jgi:hypothetical protein